MIGRVADTLSKVKETLGSNERHALPGVIWTTCCVSASCHCVCSFASLCRRSPL
ncbi:Cell division protein FtsL [Leclercia adecarboxylata]|uniref:Cell division protein FtsL n=1 Tax=Leclercia adecarboxylata TaxID=83655 RepID=A0A4U9HJ98_9ENTR|nr:Cell division protein FtsL [Leclercia adecarboxylata]